MTTVAYDREKEVKHFEDGKTGVKGLVDSGITTIPRFFIHPLETLATLTPKSSSPTDSNHLPTIDLCGVESDDLRSIIVEKVAYASRELGFFQVINHGIEREVLERVIGAIKAFHEQPAEVKMSLYSRDRTTALSFCSNVDLLHSKAATWSDMLRIRLGPTLPEPDEIPEICRKEVLEWNEHVKRLGELLMGLLCEGLGVETGRLKKMTFSEGRKMAAHYYPYCPQPDLTMGIASHTDAEAITILLQDHVGGLQVRYGEEWVDVEPVPGALVINVGDALQIMSNDEYKSVEHRVLANSSCEPRISTAVFFGTTNMDGLYGPFPELISTEKPARFRQFNYADYMSRFFSKELGGRSLVNYYRLLDA